MNLKVVNRTISLPSSMLSYLSCKEGDTLTLEKSNFGDIRTLTLSKYVESLNNDELCYICQVVAAASGLAVCLVENGRGLSMSSYERSDFFTQSKMLTAEAADYCVSDKIMLFCTKEVPFFNTPSGNVGALRAAIPATFGNKRITLAIISGSGADKVDPIKNVEELNIRLVRAVNTVKILACKEDSSLIIERGAFNACSF